MAESLKIQPGFVLTKDWTNKSLIQYSLVVIFIGLNISLSRISIMAKKPAKKSTSFPTTSNFFEFDRVFDNFRKDLEKSFSSFPRIDFSSLPKLSQTGCDIIDEGKQFRMKMNVPGLKKNEIKLNVTDNSIEVTGEHKEEEKKKNYLRKERHSLSYYQTIPLSEKVVSGKVKAKLTDGVLDVILPKSNPTPVPKKKPVKIQ